MKRLPLFCLLMSLFADTTCAREWFVQQAAPNASDTADGSAGHPLRTINAAAQLAQPGDVVTVGAGVYHEWVSPARAGAINAPIVYRSAPEHAASVRGTDVLDAQWQAAPDAPGVFTAPLPQKAFIFGNPFVRPPEPSNKEKLKWWKPTRNAMVFLKDQPLNQVTTREELIQTPGSWLSSDDGQQLLVHLQATLPPCQARLRSRPAIGSSPLIVAAWAISMSRASSSSAAPPGPIGRSWRSEYPHRAILDHPQQHRALHHR